jgi:hypothetical protein
MLEYFDSAFESIRAQNMHQMALESKMIKIKENEPKRKKGRVMFLYFFSQ